MSKGKSAGISLEAATLPVILALMEGEMTAAEVARQAGLSVMKVNSIPDELEAQHVVRRGTGVRRGEFVEPSYVLADGEVAWATVRAKLSDSPVGLITSLLSVAWREVSKVLKEHGAAGVWYSRLRLKDHCRTDLERILSGALVQAEELQRLGSGSGGEERSYRVVIAFYEMPGNADVEGDLRPWLADQEMERSDECKNCG